MIGVICKKETGRVVEEFFQLFKTQWEFFDSDHSYDVVLSTQDRIMEVDAKLVVIYGTTRRPVDAEQEIIARSKYRNVWLECEGTELPIYGSLLTFEIVGIPSMRVKGTSEVAGLAIDGPKGRILRVGFDLFQEISFLLVKGQPIEKARIPTLEIHIEILRNWILTNGIPLVEIPPVPSGHGFAVCLTHDVDFIKIGQHKLDHTLWGFVYRALIVSLKVFLAHRLSLHKLLQNYKAVLSLPLVYLGIVRDFWFQFDRYLEIETPLKSTFFIIPFKKRVGEKLTFHDRKRRATRYDINDIRDVVHKLMHKGCEIALHGIDAWHSLDLAKQELKRITEATSQSEIGIRMHWLCFEDDSPKILDKVGFFYDSTLGYNDTVGYRAGTTQVFRPLGVKNLLELPLHIQDIALFSPRSTGATQDKAWEQCEHFFHNATVHGGALSILWHMRSIAPERLWEDFYIELIDELRRRNVWFATASQVVKWFRMRRSLSFQNVSFTGETLHLVLKSNGHEADPPFVIRVHLPGRSLRIAVDSRPRHLDIPWNGEREMQIPVNVEIGFLGNIHA